MSNNLDNALAEIINKAASEVDEAVIFINGQIPDAVNQVLIFELTWNVFMSFTSALIFCLSVLLSKKGFNEDFSKCDLNIASGVAGFIVSIASFFVFAAYIKETLKIWLAPKIFLLEYAADLVK